MKTPGFDIEGYPTEETLEVIRKWEFNDKEDLIKFIADAWHYEDYVRETKPGLWIFATGGWSGNEDLMQALKENNVWLILRWQSIYLPGGLYIIAVNDEGEENFNELTKIIKDWAWNKNKVVDEQTIR